MSKGSNRRPAAVSRDEWERNYERTFDREVDARQERIDRERAARWDAFNRGDLETLDQLVEHRPASE